MRARKKLPQNKLRSTQVTKGSRLAALFVCAAPGVEWGMRSWLALLLAVVSFSAQADSLQTALQFSQAGSPHLALARVQRDQPKTPDQPGWYDWESLRLSILAQTLQTTELLQRTKLYPDNAPNDFLQKALGHQAWAQMELKQAQEARRTLARLLWLFDLNAADQKWARRLVIRSYLAEHKAQEAYRAMLRYQQDFAPVGREVAAEFVQGLLAEDQVPEALTWLVALDTQSPVYLALQLQAGLTTPEAAMAQARGALRQQPNQSAYTAIVASAAERLKDAPQQIVALEQGLNNAASGQEELLPKLWQAYLHEAERLGNQAQVLRGDDAAWLALAASMTENRQGARALYAYLLQSSQEATVRGRALLQLYVALTQAQMEQTAVQLLLAAPWRDAAVNPEELEQLVTLAAVEHPASARVFYLTAGMLEEKRRQATRAADYFTQAVLLSNLSAPDAMALRAVQAARFNLDAAGYKEDGDALYRYVVAQKAEPSKTSSKSQAKKAKHKK